MADDIALRIPIIADLAKFKQSMSTVPADVKEALAPVGAEIQKMNTSAAKAMQDVGKKVSGVGKSLTAAVTLPIAGIAVACGKAAIDFQDGMAKIGTVADTTGNNMAKLSTGITKLSNQTGNSFKDIQEGMYDAISSGVKTGDAVNFMSTAVKAAKAGFSDTKTVVDGLTSTLNSYGLATNKSKDITNQMLVAQNLGKTTIDEMAQSIGNVTPTAASLGVTTKELFSSLASLTANGIKTSEAVTGLKAAFSNVVKPSKEAGDMAASLGLQFNAAHLKSVGWSKFLEEVKQKTGGNTEKMSQLFGSVEAMNSVLVLTSKQGGKLYNDSMTQMNNNGDLLNTMYKKVSETVGAKMERALNSLKNSGVKIGAIFLPIIAKVAESLSNLSQKFSELSPASQKTIVTIGLVVAALGPLLIITGKVISAIGTIKLAIGSIGATEGLGAAAAAIGPVVLAVAALSAGAILLYKNWDTLMSGLGKLPFIAKCGATAVAGLALAAGAVFAPGIAAATVAVVGVVAAVKGFQYAMSDSIPKAEHFGSGVSAATKKALGGFLNLNDGIESTLTKVKITGTTLSGQAATAIENSFSGMGNKIKAKLDTTYQNESSSLQKFFSTSSTLTSSEEQKILAKMKTHCDQRKAQVDAYQKQVQTIINTSNTKVSQIEEAANQKVTAIKNNAANQHRQLTQKEKSDIEKLLKDASTAKQNIANDEARKIDAIRQKMALDGINILSKNQKDAKAVITQMKLDQSNLSAKAAADVVKNAEKQRKGVVDAANEQYKKTIEAIQHQHDDLGTISDSQEDKLLKDAKKQRDGIVNQANATKSQVVAAAKAQAVGHVNQVNWQTGEVLSKWAVFRNNMSSWWTGYEKDFKAGCGVIVDTVKGWGASIGKAGKWAINAMGKLATDMWNEIKSLPGKAANWGADMVHGMVKGIQGKIKDAGNAAKGVANKIANFLHFSKPDEGPLRDYEKWMPDMIDGLCKGMKSKLPDVRNAADQIAFEISNKLRKNKQAKSAGIETFSELVAGMNSQNENVKRTATMLAATYLKPLRNSVTDAKKMSVSHKSILAEHAKAVTAHAKAIAAQVKNMSGAYKTTILNLDGQVTKSLNTGKTYTQQVANTQKAMSLVKTEIALTTKNYNEMVKIKGKNSTESTNLLSKLNAENKQYGTIKKSLTTLITGHTALLKKQQDAAKDKAVATIQAKYNDMNGTLKTLETQIRKLSISTKDNNTNLANTKKAMQDTHLVAQQLRQEYEKIVAVKGKNSKEAQALIKAINDEGVAYDKLKQKAADLTEKIKEEAEKRKQAQIESINKLNDKVVSALQKSYQKQQKLAQDNLDDKKAKLEEWKQAQLDSIDDNMNEDAKNAKKKLQDQIDSIDAQEALDEDNKTNKEELDNIAALNSQLLAETDADKKADIQKQLDDANTNRAERLARKQREDQKAALQKQISDVEDGVTKREEAIKKGTDAETNMVLDKYKADKKALDDDQTAHDRMYEHLLSQANLNAEAEKLITSNKQKDIINLLNEFGDDYEEAGVTLGERLVTGISPKIASIKSMLLDVTNALNAAAGRPITPAKPSTPAADTDDQLTANTHYNRKDSSLDDAVMRAKQAYNTALAQGDKDAMARASQAAASARNQGANIGNVSWEEALAEYQRIYGIAWHANGGIFTKPTLIPTLDGIQGVGEAGPEALLPLSGLYDSIKKAFASAFKEAVVPKMMLDIDADALRGMSNSLGYGSSNVNQTFTLDDRQVEMLGGIIADSINKGVAVPSSGVQELSLNVDGRQFAKATMPYISNELAKSINNRRR